MPYGRRTARSTFRKRKFYNRKKSNTRLRKRSIAASYRALRIAKSVSRKVAAELCKFESTPDLFRNYQVSQSDTNFTVSVPQYPLKTITSGIPFVYPLNWVYETLGNPTGAQQQTVAMLNIDNERMYPKLNNPIMNLSQKRPIWYNTLSTNVNDPNDDVSTQLQYKMAYIYINALFNASVSGSINNNDGAMRIVILKDKQPTAGAPTWFVSPTNSSGTNVPLTGTSRGVFNADRIDAQLNPDSVGRFKIMYDKTLRFNTINGYKPFKYYKRMNTVVRNNIAQPYKVDSQQPSLLGANLYSSSYPCPVLKNAFYLMIFSDGITLNYTTDASTPAASFHLFHRIGYYNN